SCPSRAAATGRVFRSGGAMRKPESARVSAVLAGVVLLVAANASVAGPTPSPAAKTASTKTVDKPWAAPKTPWGDPDLQGTWTTDSAFGIPLQRPQQFAGRAELNDEEFAQKVERDTRTRTSAESAVGSFRGDGAWLTKSFRQTSLIVEPADG